MTATFSLASITRNRNNKINSMPHFCSRTHNPLVSQLKSPTLSPKLFQRPYPIKMPYSWQADLLPSSPGLALLVREQLCCGPLPTQLFPVCILIPFLPPSTPPQPNFSHALSLAYPGVKLGVASRFSCHVDWHISQGQRLMFFFFLFSFHHSLSTSWTRHLVGLTECHFIYSHSMRPCTIKCEWSELLWLINFHIT